MKTFLLFISLLFLDSEAGRVSIQRRSVDIEETDWAKITCTCNDETNEFRVDPYVSANDLESPNCSMNVGTTLCDLMKKCEHCSLKNQLCFGSLTGRGKECIKTYVELQNIPASIEIPGISELFNKKTARPRRSPLNCPYPAYMRTANVHCRTYDSFMTCKEKCIFGYTLKEGISKELSCKYEEQLWNPSGFEECEPFIDCNLILLSTGSMDCITGGKAAPSCNVTCDEYEDHKPVPMQNYECKVTGEFSRPLPFCVAVASGMALVPPPSIRVHREDNGIWKKHGFA